MISRVYLQGNEGQPLYRTNKPASSPSPRRRNALNGWLILTLLSTLYIAWLAYRWSSQPAWLAYLPTTLFEAISLAEMAAAITFIFLWSALIWQNHLSRKSANQSHDLSKEQLFALDPKSFEFYVAALFRKKGYQVTVRGASGDHGVDLELTGANGKRAIVQCKRYRDTVGEKVVRDLFGTLLHERASRAFLVTTADISEAAAKWSQGKPITLIDGDMLLAIASALSQPKHG